MAILSLEYVSFARNDHIIDNIIERTKTLKKPLIILTGGTTHIKNLKKLIKFLPYTKVVIGGDGGGYKEIELNESVKYIFLRHYNMYGIVNIRGDQSSMAIRTSKGLYKSITIDLKI